jgi:hypothetical protein
MANLLKDGLAWLNSQMKSHAADAFTYRRGAYSVVLQVTKGAVRVTPLTVLAGVMSDRDSSQPSPLHVDHPLWFNAEDLVINGSLTKPQIGDTMEQTVNGVTTVYTLAAPLDGGREYRYADGFETGPEARICFNGRLKSVT